MNMHATILSPPSFYFFLTILAHCIIIPSNCALESFIFAGCSQLKYDVGTPYESNVNSVLSSIVNSASFANFNNFKISLPGSTSNDIVYGLFQCRGDLSNPDCHECVLNAVSRLGSTCVGASAGALQMEGCYVRYDNTSFLGVQDKSVVFSKCGPSIGNDQDMWTSRDGMLSYLAVGGQFFRVSGTGKVQGMVQCMQDLSTSECQDCVSEAIRRLKNECGSSAWGNMFLGKCYARYSDRGYFSSKNNGNDEEVQKTLAILIALIAGVAVLVVFLAFLSKFCDKEAGGK